MKKINTKNPGFHKTKLALLILLLFVAGQVGGILTIRSLFLTFEMEELEPLAQEMADSYITYGDVRNFGSQEIKLYDTSGNEIELNDHNKKIDSEEITDSVGGDTIADTDGTVDGVSSDEITDSTLELKTDAIADTQVPAEYLEKVLAGETVAAIENINEESGQTVIIGVPIMEDDKVVGALFLMNPVVEYRAILTGFVIVFSVTLSIGLILIGYFFYHYFRKTRELEKTERDYVANISHELKSPIASIKALTETLCDGMVKEEETKSRYYGIIISETNRLEKLVMDMLQLSRMQSQKMDFSKEMVKADIIFLPVLEKYQVLCDEMGIEFVVSEEINRLPDLYTNVERITQLLIIYLDNAVKFVQEDGKIILSAEITNRMVTIFVKDNGVGIDKDILPFVFQRFYKEDKAHNTKGSGLGLAIAKEIATGLKEKLEVSSKLNQGSTFSFTVHTQR